MQQGTNERSEKLLKNINDAGKIHMVPSKIRGTFIIRFAVCSRYTESKDIVLAWQEIVHQADQLVGLDSLQ